MKYKQRNHKIYLKYSPKKKFNHTVIINFLKKIKNQQNKKLVDIGCGNGSWLCYLRDNTKFNLEGSETDYTQLSYCKKNHKFAKFYFDDITKRPKNKFKNYADVLCAIGVNQIFDDQKKIIKNEISRLKKGGTLIISGILNSEKVDLLTRYKLIKNKNFTNENYTRGWNIFSIHSTILILKSYGLKEIRYKKISFPKSLKVPKNIKDPIRSHTYLRGKNVEFKNILPIRQENYIISAKK